MMHALDTDITQPIDTTAAQESPYQRLARSLAQLADIELDFSELVISRYGHRAREVVRESRASAELARSHSLKLEARYGEPSR